MPYTEVSISSYNAMPPTDDGASGATNQITWAGIKTKLGDPLKTALESVDDNVATACDTLDSAIAAAESEITTISGNITSQESADLTAPSDTELFFVQTAAPTGWTKITTHNNKGIRLVSGTVSTGGSTAFTSVLTSRTLTTSLMPSHSHSIEDSGSVSLNRTTWSVDVNQSESGRAPASARQAYADVDWDTEALSATVDFSGTTGSTGSGTAMDFAVQYVDVILASKD